MGVGAESVLSMYKTWVQYNTAVRKVPALVGGGSTVDHRPGYWWDTERPRLQDLSVFTKSS